MASGGGQATQLTHKSSTDRVAAWQPLQGPAPKSQCEDGLVNDGDGLTDYPANEAVLAPKGRSQRMLRLRNDDERSEA